MVHFQTEVARTDVFRVNPSTFEEAVDLALNAEFHSKAYRYDIQWDTSSSVDKTKPMDLSHDGEEAEFHAAKQQRNIRKFYMCESTKHLRQICPLRKKRQHRPNEASAPGRNIGKAGKNVNSQKVHGALMGKDWVL